MAPLLILITALIFFFLGRYSVPTRKPENDTIDAIVDRARSMVTPSRAVIPPGVVPFKTPEDFEYEKSGEKALDERWKESGIGKELMK